MEPGTLPPTSAAEMYHSLRVYYHIMYSKRKGANVKQEELELFFLMGNGYLRRQACRSSRNVIHHILETLARNCATQRGAYVDNTVFIAAMFAHRMQLG